MKSAVILLTLTIGLVLGRKMDSECRFSEYSLILDKSGSISDQEFIDLMFFARRVVEVAGASFDLNRVAVSLFDTTIEEEFSCETHMNEASVLTAIDNVGTNSQGGTDFIPALMEGERVLSTGGCGDRPDVSSRVIILFTDGQNIPNQSSVVALADDIRSRGFIILVVALRPVPGDLQFLNQVAGSADQFFEVQSINDTLNESFLERLLRPICIEDDKPAPFPKCSVDPWMYKGLTMNPSDISMMPGNCTEDRIKYAIKRLNEQIEKIKMKIGNFKMTRKTLQMRVLNQHYYIAELVFRRVSDCTVYIECKLPAWKETLLKKKAYLEKQLYMMKFGLEKLMDNMVEHKKW